MPPNPQAVWEQVPRWNLRIIRTSCVNQRCGLPENVAHFTQSRYVFIQTGRRQLTMVDYWAVFVLAALMSLLRKGRCVAALLWSAESRVPVVLRAFDIVALFVFLHDYVVGRLVPRRMLFVGVPVCFCGMSLQYIPQACILRCSRLLINTRTQRTHLSTFNCSCF